MWLWAMTDVNGGVELDAGHLGAGEEAADVDVVDRVAGDGAERGAEAADDARLLAVRDGVVADDMVADVLLGSSRSQGALDGLDVALGGVGRGVVILVAVFAQGDAGADRVADHVVLDDPALAPMGADQADLLGRGRRPGGGGVAHREAAHGDVVDARLFRVEHGAADVDLDQLLVRVDARELRPDGGVRPCPPAASPSSRAAPLR
jgi:hypothetical protein